ncbi:hypothetical protein HanIR_Chr01g0009721 [Helianthus annuus]|nr:hypothetical protein HanIR_Chr01g0009721 [Helianthus annuus]
MDSARRTYRYAIVRCQNRDLQVVSKFLRLKTTDFRICCAKVLDLQAYKFSDLNS